MLLAQTDYARKDEVRQLDEGIGCCKALLALFLAADSRRLYWAIESGQRRRLIYRASSRFESELVVIYFDPIAIGILQINLLYAVRAILYLAVAFCGIVRMAIAVAVLYLHLVKACHKCR